MIHVVKEKPRNIQGQVNDKMAFKTVSNGKAAKTGQLGRIVNLADEFGRDSYNKWHLTRPPNIHSHAAGFFPNPSLWEFERQIQKRKRKEKIKQQYLTGLISRKSWMR